MIMHILRFVRKEQLLRFIKLNKMTCSAELVLHNKEIMM